MQTTSPPLHLLLLSVSEDAPLPPDVVSLSPHELVSYTLHFPTVLVEVSQNDHLKAFQLKLIPAKHMQYQ